GRAAAAKTRRPLQWNGEFARRDGARIEQATTASSGSKAGGPLVRNPRPKPSHISITQRRERGASTWRDSSHAAIAPLKQAASRKSVVSICAAPNGRNIVA